MVILVDDLSLPLHDLNLFVELINDGPLYQELKKERAKAIAALKSLQEKLEEEHKMELEEKVLFDVDSICQLS